MNRRIVTCLILGLAATVALLSAAQAGDELKGNILVRTLKAGEASLVLFVNPTGESARTMILCRSSMEDARQYLSGAEMGGVTLLPGSKVTLQKDSSTSFTDGTNLKGTYIQIECK